MPSLRLELFGQFDSTDLDIFALVIPVAQGDGVVLGSGRKPGYVEAGSAVWCDGEVLVKRGDERVRRRRVVGAGALDRRGVVHVHPQPPGDGLEVDRDRVSWGA